MSRKIYIPTIRTYSGGTLVLATLCQCLRDAGYDARLLIIPYFNDKKINSLRYYYDCIIKNIKYLSKIFLLKNFGSFIFKDKLHKSFFSAADITKLSGIKVQWHPFISKDSIVIYSEDIYGNPLHVRNVVRWLLYYFDYKNDIAAYTEKDIFIAYREVYNDTFLNPNNYIVTINSFNNELYKQYNFNERTGVCYIIHKGFNRVDLPDDYQGPVFNANMTQEELVDMLNNHKYCYCYDPQTFYMQIAVVCGCIPILILEPDKNVTDYLSNSEHHYGIAYGNTKEQIQYAINTRDLCLNELNFSAKNKKSTQTLISILEKSFGNLKKL